MANPGRDPYTASLLTSHDPENGNTEGVDESESGAIDGEQPGNDLHEAMQDFHQAHAMQDFKGMARSFAVAHKIMGLHDYSTDGADKNEGVQGEADDDES